MSKKRKSQERHLRMLIREACIQESHGNMPCPIETAEKLKASGAQPDEVMAWVGELMDVYRGAPTEQLSKEMIPAPNPLSIVAVERYRRKGASAGLSRSTLRKGSMILGAGFE